MSAIALLMGLLLLSFLGSLIVRGRGTAAGLPSGIEYLGLGLAVGPTALGMVERTMITEFEPIVQVALGWLAFIIGLDFGRVGHRQARQSSMLLGVACAILTGIVVAVTLHLFIARVSIPGLTKSDALLLSVGAGAVTAETTRLAVQWVAARWTAKGPVTDLLGEIAASDDFVPLVAAGAIFGFIPGNDLSATLPAGGWFAASLVLGALLGTMTALLLRGAEGYTVWGALIGVLLLGVGIAMRFGFCTIFVTFVMGIALAALSPSRRILRRMVGSTERPVLYPMLLLAGARIDIRPLLESRMLVAVVALALLARIVGKIFAGFLIRATVPASRPAGFGLGMVLLSSGPLTISTGFVFALRFPGVVGDTLLVMAAASAVVGELISTFALKSLLSHAGEVPPPRSEMPKPIDTPLPVSQPPRSSAPPPPPSLRELG